MSKNKGYRGYTCEVINNRNNFFYKGVRTTKKRVPIEVLERITPKKVETTAESICSKVYTYIKSNGQTTYYCNGEVISKNKIPREQLREWWDISNEEDHDNNFYPNFYSGNKYQKELNYGCEEVPNHNSPELKLLQSYGIETRNDWKRWMLFNHPDKNPDVNLDLVARINSAIDICKIF